MSEPRVSNAQLEELISVDAQYPAPPSHLGTKRRQSALLDLRDCRAELAAMQRERDDAREQIVIIQEAQQFSTPSDPTGVRNGMRFKAIEAERDALRAQVAAARQIISSSVDRDDKWAKAFLADTAGQPK